MGEKLDAISHNIEDSLFDWLTETGKTAADDHETSAMICGAVGGLLRYTISAQKNARTALEISAHLAAIMKTLAIQMDRPEGASVQ